MELGVTGNVISVTYIDDYIYVRFCRFLLAYNVSVLYKMTIKV